MGRWSYHTWGDYDRDGDLDLFVGAYEATQPYLFRNEGLGQFTPIPANNAWTVNGVAVRGSAPAWGDYDKDGWLDLIVGYWGNGGGGAAYGKNTLVHNLGVAQMEAITNSAMSIISYVENWEWIDFDGDGDLDLFATTSGDASQRDLLFVNVGGGTFVRNTTNLLVQNQALNIGQAWGDYDNDQDLDLYLPIYEGGTSQLYTNQGGGNFAIGTHVPTMALSHPMAAKWVDYDNDGLLDLFVTCYDARNRLFRNVGNGNFIEILVGSLVNERTSGSCFCAWGDYDGDGFPDLFVANESPMPNFLYHNSPNGNHWLKVKLRGTTSNTDGLGALVKARARIAGNTYWQTRRIASGTQSPELIACFGLGDATNVITLRVEWLSGVVEELGSLPAGQIVTLVEPSLKCVLGADNQSHLLMTMSTNRLYQLEASSDLTSWTTLTNCTGSANCAPVEFVDPEVITSHTARFYRMR